MPLLTTCTSMTGGQAATNGSGQDEFFTFAGTWATGEKFQVVFTDSHTGLITQVGSGTVTGIQPTFVFTFNQKVYFLAGTIVYFCALGQPTIFNDPNGIGNGFIQLTDFFASTQNTLAIANYQGRLALVARDNIQIWLIDPDPAQNQQVQILENTGTFASESVKSLGDLDVIYLNDTGLRSLRVRDSSLGAFVVDIGSPIDGLVQTNLVANTPTNNALASGVVEPLSSRYWCHLNGVIYVLSYFPGSKVIAWSTYSPTYDDLAVQITLNSSSGNLFIQAPYADSTIHNITGTVATQNFPIQTVIALVNAVNALTGTTGYTATHNSTTITLIPPSGVTNLFTVNVPLISGTASYVLQQNQPSFTPQKFVTYNGQVYCRTSDACYQYGGANNNTYDGCVASWATSFMSLKTPGVMKQSQSIGLAMTGTWQVSGGMDPQSQVLKTIWDGTKTGNQNSYDGGRLSWSTQGSHVKFQAQSYGIGACVFSGLNLLYEGGDKR